MIFINLNLFATLTRLSPENPDSYPVDEGTTAGLLVDSLGIDRSQARLIFVNGRKGSFDTLLQDGDRVGIFPPVGGG